MGHDPSKVLMGSTVSSDRPGSTTYSSDPALFSAGVACRVGTDGLLTKTKGTNSFAGISLGKSLSDSKKTTVLRLGSGVPLALALNRASSTATITSFANLVSGTADTLAIGATTFTAQAGAATLGQATFQAASSNNATATSLAAQINAHATANTVVVASANGAVVTISARNAGVAGNAVTIAYTNGDANVGMTLGNATGGHLNGGSDAIGDVSYVAVGSKAYVDDLTGLATENKGGSTATDAIYVSTVLTGITEDGASIPVALVDFIGGL
jgi:hypothetical protein